MPLAHSVSFALAASLVAAPLLAADRLILRNLDIITGRTVTSFDEDGLVLDQPRPGGSTRVTWDEIERGRIAADQSRFENLLTDLGLPLFRVRQRLKAGDYRAAGEAAEPLYSRFAERTSQTAYLVCQATMWSRLAAGQREAAVEPFLRCYELLRSRTAASSALPGPRRLKVDEPTALSSELPPVWLDPAAAQEALPGVEAAIRAMASPRPAGVYLYYATLAITAGEQSEVDRMLPLLAANPLPLAALGDLVRAQQELAGLPATGAIDRLRQQLPNLPEACRLAAYYCVGTADARADDVEQCRSGLLTLLTLPAAHGDQQPELAAAALYQTAAGLDKLKDETGAAAVRGELAARYTGTRFQQQIQGKLDR